jgi:hypothetical protein
MRFGKISRPSAYVTTVLLPSEFSYQFQLACVWGYRLGSIHDTHIRTDRRGDGILVVPVTTYKMSWEACLEGLRKTAKILVRIPVPWAKTWIQDLSKTKHKNWPVNCITICKTSLYVERNFAIHRSCLLKIKYREYKAVSLCLGWCITTPQCAVGCREVFPQC